MKRDKPINSDIGKGFENVSKGSQLSTQVAVHLREKILSGKLVHGQFLRIDATARALGVSMTPVREGLLLLQSEGFVHLMPRRGFVVNSLKRQDLRDLFWVQATVAAELTSRATERMSDEEIGQLEQLLRDYEAAIDEGNQELEDRLGHEFHRRINLAAESNHLAQLLGRLTKRVPNRFYTTIEGQLKDALEYHPLILKAIKERDAATAASLMFRHVDKGGEHLVAMLEKAGMWDESAATDEPGAD